MSNQATSASPSPIKVIENKSRVWLNAPYGEFRGVIVGYALQDQVEETFGDQTQVNDKIQFLVQIEERISEDALLAAAAAQGREVTDDVREQIGQRYVVRTKRYNRKLSLADSKYPTGLNKALNSWLSHKLTNEEIKAFHPNNLFGTPVAVVITPSEKLDKSGNPYLQVEVNPWSKFAGEGLKPEGELIFIPHRDRKADEESK